MTRTGISPVLTNWDSMYSGAEKVLAWLGKDTTDFNNSYRFTTNLLLPSTSRVRNLIFIVSRVNVGSTIFGDVVGMEERNGPLTVIS